MHSNRRKISGIGGRTGKDLLKGKNIRKHADGTDAFEDYFTDSSDETTCTSASHASVSQTPGVSARYSEAIDKEHTPGVSCSSPIKSKSQRKVVIGSRSQKNILPPKNIRKLSDGTDNYKDYYTSGSYESAFHSAIPENSSPVHSPRVSSKSKNSSKTPPAVAHSSPITRLSNSKVIGNDVDNPISPRSEEEICPLLSNAFTTKIKRSKGSTRKSIHEKRDLCDEKLLKLAEENEKSQNLSDSELHAAKEANLNISKNFKTSQRIASKSPMKKTVSNVSPEKPHYLTRSHNGSPTNPQSENTDNLLIKTTDKNISSNKHCYEQNISKASYSNALGSKLQRSKSQQSHFDINSAQNFEKSYEVNPVPEQDSGNKSSARKFLVKRNSSKKSSNSFVVSSPMHGKNVQSSKDLLDLTVPLHVDPHCLAISNEANLNDHDSQLSETEKNDSNPSETLEIIQKIGSKSPKNAVSFVSPEEHHLTAPSIETSIETQSRNMDDMLVRTSPENIPKTKQNTSKSHELQRNTSVHSHFDVNTAQDSKESSEENGAAEKKSTSYKNRTSPVKRKSSLTSDAARKKKANSFSTSAKKRRPVDKNKEKMSSTLNLSDKSLNKTNKNVQHVEGSLHTVLNATYQVNSPEFSLASNEETLRETNKNKVSFQISAKAHKNVENGEKNEQTGKQKKVNKSHENPKPKTKDKRNSVAQENEASDSFRRSSRKKMPPLENWRNQRARYKIDNGSIQLFQIEEGNKEDDGSKKAIAARLDKYKKMKEKSKRKPAKPPNFKFKDLVLQKKVALPLIKKFNLIPWEGEPNENGPYCIKKVIQTPNSNFGFIEIKAGKSKPQQYLPNEDVYLCLIQGKLKALIGEDEITLAEKDTLVVPRSVPYTLTNEGRKKALLVFSVGRYKYLENVILK